MPQDNNNALMSYRSNSESFAVGCKVSGIAYKWESIFTESHAKRYRAMYPHQLAISHFKLKMELNGYYEQRNFLNFLKTYSETAIYGAAQPMWVMVDARNFARYGFPISGINEQERVGSMVFQPEVIFESVTDPLDPTLFTQASHFISQYDLAGTENDVKNFFYPFSRASYDTTVKPETIYDLDGPQNPAVVDQLGGALNPSGPLTDAVGGALDALDRRTP